MLINCVVVSHCEVNVLLVTGTSCCQGCTEGKSAALCRLDRWDTRTKQGAVQEFHAPQGLDRVAGHADGYNGKESFRCLATSGKHYASTCKGIGKCVCLASTSLRKHCDASIAPDSQALSGICPTGGPSGPLLLHS